MADRRILVLGDDAQAVGRRVQQLRDSGHRVAGFVGQDQEVAREMAAEMLGGVDEVVQAECGELRVPDQEAPRRR